MIAHSIALAPQPSKLSKKNGCILSWHAKHSLPEGVLGKTHLFQLSTEVVGPQSSKPYTKAGCTMCWLSERSLSGGKTFVQADVFATTVGAPDPEAWRVSKLLRHGD